MVSRLDACASRGGCEYCSTDCFSHLVRPLQAASEVINLADYGIEELPWISDSEDEADASSTILADLGRKASTWRDSPLQTRNPRAQQVFNSLWFFLTDFIVHAAGMDIKVLADATDNVLDQNEMLLLQKAGDSGVWLISVIYACLWVQDLTKEDAAQSKKLAELFSSRQEIIVKMHLVSDILDAALQRAKAATALMGMTD